MKEIDYSCYIPPFYFELPEYEDDPDYLMVLGDENGELLPIVKGPCVGDAIEFWDLVELNVKNTFKEGFIIRNFEIRRRQDGAFYVLFQTLNKKMEFLTSEAMTLIGNQFVSGSINISGDTMEKKTKDLVTLFESFYLEGEGEE